MHSSFSPTGSTNAQQMVIEKRSQFLGSKRVSTLRSQPPQSKSNDSWMNASNFLIESQEATTKENRGDSLRTATGYDKICEVCQGSEKVGTSLTAHQQIMDVLRTYLIRSSSRSSWKGESCSANVIFIY